MCHLQLRIERGSSRGPRLCHIKLKFGQRLPACNVDVPAFIERRYEQSLIFYGLALYYQFTYRDGEFRYSHPRNHRCDVLIEADRWMAQADFHVYVDDDAEMHDIDAELLG